MEEVVWILWRLWRRRRWWFRFTVKAGALRVEIGAYQRRIWWLGDRGVERVDVVRDLPLYDTVTDGEGKEVVLLGKFAGRELVLVVEHVDAAPVAGSDDMGSGDFLEH